MNGQQNGRRGWGGGGLNLKNIKIKFYLHQIIKNVQVIIFLNIYFESSQ